MAGAVAMVKAFAAALVAAGAHVLTEFELHGFAQCALEKLPEGIAGVAQQGGVVGVGCPRYDRVGHRVLLGLIEHSLGSLDGRLLFFPARRPIGFTLLHTSMDAGRRYARRPRAARFSNRCTTSLGPFS